MKPRVAIVCSGVGHIRRGNETWARTVAEGLHASGAEVTLFGGGKFAPACDYVRVPNWKRDFILTRKLLPWHHRYLIEQLSFEFFLQRHLRRDPYDIIHACDPILALRLQRCATALRAHIIYKDGLLLGPSWCEKFDFVQVLAPYYCDLAEDLQTRGRFVISHLVNTETFSPAVNRAAVRARRLGNAVPEDAFVVLAVGDFSPASNKRLDWIVQEIARIRGEDLPHLVLVGQARPRELEQLKLRATKLLGERAHVFANAAPHEMPEWYQAADVFAHAALREPFGIVFLEAMASGLPVAGHEFPVTWWIIGEGGQTVDMTAPGQLAKTLIAWQHDGALLHKLSAQARDRARRIFAQERIIPLYQRMYQRILSH